MIKPERFIIYICITVAMIALQNIIEGAMGIEVNVSGWRKFIYECMFFVVGGASTALLFWAIGWLA